MATGSDGLSATLWVYLRDPSWGGSVLQLEDPGSSGHEDGQSLENIAMKDSFK